jgi:hypothetical protein
MWKRMIGMLTVTIAIVAGLGFVKFQQIQTAIAEGAAFQPPRRPSPPWWRKRKSGPSR